MSTQPLVSIVVPARDEGPNIAEALEAVAAQTYPLESIEVVVVDGGSTDDTSENAAKCLANGAFARWAVLDNPTGSTPSNLNLGLAWAEGSIVVRIDARSVVPSDYVQRCVAALEVADRSVVGGSQVAVARSGDWRAKAIARALNNRLAMGGSRYRRAGASSGPADTVYLGVFRADQLRKAGGWNEQFSTNQDFELNRRMSAFGSVWFEAGLPVAYQPRRTHRELAQQYHRFGRWKAKYWRSTSDRPRPRQVALIAGPPAVATMAGVAVASIGGSAIVVVPAGFVVGCALVDGVGGHRDNSSAAVKLAAGLTNVLIGASWWTGVVRGFVIGRRP